MLYLWIIHYLGHGKITLMKDKSLCLTTIVLHASFSICSFSDSFTGFQRSLHRPEWGGNFFIRWDSSMRAGTRKKKNREFRIILENLLNRLIIFFLIQQELTDMREKLHVSLSEQDC